jgi:hypothetical protein
MRALFGPTAAIVTILSLGLWLDRVEAGCDNNCREKTIHKFCDGGNGWPCIKFVYKTCLFCQSGFTFRCDNTIPSFGMQCTPAVINPYTAFYKYENCDDECICEQDITVVEAKNLEGDSVYTPSIRRDNCAPPSW